MPKKGYKQSESHRKFNMKEVVGYRALHEWVQRWKGKPKKCSVCGKEKNRVSWANIDHKYSRVLDDYIRMCPKCHGEYDSLNNLRKHNK